MSASASTPRIRLTQLIYLLVLALVALSDGRSIEGGAGLIAQAAGFSLVVVAVLGRLWITLFIAGRKDAELVRVGPYASCRHPLYLGSMIAALGLALSTRSVVLTVLLPLAVAWFGANAARREDAALQQAHGAEWLRYRNAVPAFWPRRSTGGTQEWITVPPRIYRKAFLDAASFLALWLAVVVIDTLRSGGAWQALFRLP